MKKALLLLVLLLAACGQEGPENVSEAFAADSKQLLDLFQEAADQKRELTDEEIEIIESYKIRYEDNDALSNEEGYIKSGVSLASTIYFTDGKLASDYLELEQVTSDMHEFMETGEMPK